MGEINYLSRLCLISHRSFNRERLRLCLYGVLFFCIFALPASGLQAAVQEEKVLKFYHLHTDERLEVVYKRGDEYDRTALKKIDHLLRDHRAKEVTPIDPELLDFLYDLQQRVKNSRAIHVVCGYRSPHTNQMLRNKSNGVASKSLHMQGKALDFRLPGTDTAVLRDVARTMKRGGVGYYKKSDFIQIDTGRVRFW